MYRASGVAGGRGLGQCAKGLFDLLSSLLVTYEHYYNPFVPMGTRRTKHRFT